MSEAVTNWRVLLVSFPNGCQFLAVPLNTPYPWDHAVPFIEPIGQEI